MTPPRANPELAKTLRRSKVAGRILGLLGRYDLSVPELAVSLRSVACEGTVRHWVSVFRLTGHVVSARHTVRIRRGGRAAEAWRAV